MSHAIAGACAPSIDPAPWAEQLLQTGYCVVPDLVPSWKIKAFAGDIHERFERTPFCEGDFYGRNTKRFGGLLKRSQHAEALVAHPTILDITERVLSPHCDRFQLNLTQAVQLHPGQTAQVPHRDQDMWRGVPGAAEYLVNVMWPISPFTEENGATVLWPNSHTWGVEDEPDPNDAITVEMNPGEALLFLGSTLHGGGANCAQTPRTGLIVSYCLGWLKPYENQWLVYPPEVARRFSPEVAALVGYQQHRPNLGNYEGQCPSVLLQDEVGDYLSATDELRPDQVELLSEYMQSVQT